MESGEGATLAWVVDIRSLGTEGAALDFLGL